MSSDTTPSKPRVPPIKLLGARRAFASLGYGAILGPAVGMIVSVVFLPVATTDSLRTGLIMMSLFFGLFLGPVLTLGAASMLAVAGFSRSDFGAAGWTRLILFSLLGCGVGIAIGFFAGTVYVQMVPAGDAIIFMFAMLCGIVGALVPGSVLVGRAAKRRVTG
jgi:hypothetical protein